MTWGQIRFLLQTGAPGVSTDLLDEWISARYGFILDHYPWKGLEEEATLETVAAYQTGTVSVNSGSTAVTGVGTTFTSGMTGMRMQIDGGDPGPIYTVTYVSATSLTLDRAYEDSANAVGVGFSIFQNEYTLPADLKTLLELDSSCNGLPLEEWPKKKISESVGFRFCLGDPEVYAISADTSEAAPPVLHTVEVYPAPLYARGLPMRYQKAALNFTGENTGNAPLPFVPAKAILDGVRIDIKRHQGDLASSESYGVEFALDLVEMVRLDVQRRAKPPEPRMKQSLVAYRFRRVVR